MRSRTNVLKLMLQRYVNDGNNSNNNNIDDGNNSKNKKDSNIDIDQTMYSFYNTNIVLEILILIEYIISATTSRSHIDELRDIVQETIIINQQQSIEEEEEEEDQEPNRNFNNNNDMSFLNNQEVLQMAYKITQNLIIVNIMLQKMLIMKKQINQEGKMVMQQRIFKLWKIWTQTTFIKK